MAKRVKNNLHIEVLTPSGFVPFSGIMKTEHDMKVKLTFDDGSILQCSDSHRIKVSDGSFVCAKNLISNHILSSGHVVKTLEILPGQVELFDILDVDGHEYYTNDIISHNCEMLSDDPLLINSRVLQSLQASRPLYIDKGFWFWKEFDANKTYIVSSDVSEGMQKDFSTIEVFSLDDLEQIAEFRQNNIKEDKLYEAIKWVIKKILESKDPRTQRKPSIYWSFENNSCGAVIGALHMQDEKFPEEPQLISEKGSRLGMRTVNKSKLEGARHLKSLVEKAKGGYQIHSERLIFELKNYVATGASYAAKYGATDDLVSAMLINSRIIAQLAAYEPEVFDTLYRSDGNFDDENDDEFNSDAPIPFVF
jgi:hypothetical protein